MTLRFPRVAVLAGEGVSATGYGHVWYTLEREFALPFTALRAASVRSTRLSNFDVIVMPDGFGYGRQFGDSAGVLTAWVRQGGVLIGIGGAASYLADADLELTSARQVGAEDEEDDEDEESAPPAESDLPPDDGALMPPLVSATGGEGAPLDVPGTIMRATLDLTNPLTFGYEDSDLPVLVRGADFYQPSKEGSNPVVFTGENLVISGFVWPDNTEKLLRGTAWMVQERVGEGKVILFADDPTFRLIWPSLSRLFLNAILIAPTIP